MTVQLGRKHGLIGTDHNDPLLEGEDLSHTIAHQAVIMYLLLVLKRLFADQPVGSTSDVNIRFRQPQEEAKYTTFYKSPDIMVIDGLEVSETNSQATYDIGENNPPPRVAIEIASEETWPIDLEKKPITYAIMGIKEYFVYDPNQVWKGEWRKNKQLIGWRLDASLRNYIPIPKEAKGMWSEQLQSWLVIENDGRLRLYDAQDQLRLTDEEAARQRAETERQRAEIELQRIEKLKARLRELGENPDDLLK